MLLHKSMYTPKLRFNLSEPHRGRKWPEYDPLSCLDFEIEVKQMEHSRLIEDIIERRELAV